MKHYPSLIPYLIKRHTEIDPVTGEKIWDYTKEYHLYDVKNKRILMQEIPFKNISYIDYSFEKSSGLIIEKSEDGRSVYSIIETIRDFRKSLVVYRHESFVARYYCGLS